MGLKTFSEQFREDLLRINLQTPPDVVVGLTDLGGSLSYSAYKDSRGADTVLHSSPVADAGNVLDIAADIRKFLFKRNLQTPTDIEHAIIDLSANQSETMRNMGAIGTDATINWRSVVVDSGTIDNAAMATREANLSRNKPRDLTDPSESNTDVTGEGYNYSSLLQTLGTPAQINNFIVPNVQSISSTENKVNKEARALDLKINKYIPDEYQAAVIRENILNEIYKRTTYVDEYTNSLKSKNPINYSYFSFYDLNNKATLNDVVTRSTNLIENDTALMNIGAYMLNYNLRARLEQNLYDETIGKLNLINKNYNSDFPVSIDPLELIKIAKDPLNNLIEKNYTITTPRNFIGKTAQFLLGLEGVVSPFDLWDSVDLGGKDLTPNFLASNEGLDAMKELDPTSANSPQNSKDGTAKISSRSKKDDDSLLKKTGGGQRWSLYENLLMNKYSPKFDTPAELIGFQKKPKGIYYLGSEDRPPIDILQARDGISIINNNALSSEFNKGYDDPDKDIVWVTNAYDVEGVENNSDFGDSAVGNGVFSSEFYFRPNSLMDITQKLVYIGGIDSPIRNLKTKFRDGKIVYSKGAAIKKVDVSVVNDKNKYKIQDPWENGFCRTWTKLKPYSKVNHLVRYGELIRRERNSVIDRNANYNIYPTKLNVGTLYDQNMLNQDGIRDRFADKNFDKVRARKYMFSIENLAWKDSEKYNDLPAFEQGSNGGRVMWFPPYGLTFNESSSASWTKHYFLGRPEPVYTYNNTERSGTLSWIVVVDHPTILNVMVQKELESMNDEQVDDILAAFFAGCVQYDIFELARIWGMFSNADIAFFKDVINGQYPYPSNMTNEKKYTYNYKVSTDVKTTQKGKDDEELKTDLSKLKFFFPNDVPKVNDTRSYDTIFTEYSGWLTAGLQDEKYDYFNTIGASNASLAQYFITSPQDGGRESVNIATEWESIDKSATLIRNYVTNHPDSTVRISFEASASSIADKEYNKKLAKRRALSVANWYASQIGLTNITTEDNNTDFTITINRENSTPAVIFKANFTEKIGEKSVSDMFYDVGFTFGTTPIVYNTGTEIISKKDYTENQFTSDKWDDRYCAILSYPASYARRVTLKVDTELYDKTEFKTVTDVTAAEDPQSANYEGKTTERYNVINKRDIATRILNKLIGENEYFQFLSENSPVVFDSLKEKLKYFSPAFHSMTPEGLNSRLTFLQQCVRPGDTIKTVGSDSNDIVNTAFGKPPVCVLRIGDFFNTRMIIENITINYNVVGSSVTYDLNPEGIGVQPMIAKVDLTVKYVGGAGLREPVAQLQNALSYNYYANADMYESRSFGQTDADERYLDNLELAYNSDVLDIEDLNFEALLNINPDVNTNFTQLGLIDNPKKYSPISITDAEYKSAHKIQEGLDIVQYYDVDYSKLYQNLYTSFNNYISSYFDSFSDILNTNPNDFFALEYGAFSTTVNKDSARLDFGSKKNDNQFDSSKYPNLANGLSKSMNYFTIGYDSFNKSNSVAVTPKLHLYPQVDDRIVNPVEYGIQDFAGVSVPKYVDLDYVNSKLEKHFLNYIGYLTCEEWYLFDDNSPLRDELYKLPVAVLYAFKNFTNSKFVEYFRGISANKLQKAGELRDLFVKLYSNVLATNSICNGIDGGTSTDKSFVRYLEVVPNYSGSTSNEFTLNEFFGAEIDDCLNNYAKNMSNIITYGQTYALPDDATRGLFNYLENQVSCSKNSHWLDNNKPCYDFTSGEWKVGGTAVTNISCKTVFEKLNFERLYFGQLSQSLISGDVLSGELKQFTSETKNKSLINWIYTDSVKSSVSISIPTKVSGGITSYDYETIKYNGSNENIANAVRVLQNNRVKLEDAIFYGFIKYFLLPSTISELLVAMSSAVSVSSTIKELAMVDKFITHLKAVKLTDFDNSMNTIVNEMKSIAKNSSTNVNSDVIAPINLAIASNGSYKLKMFEVSESRANIHGRKAMKEYFQFASANPTKND